MADVSDTIWETCKTYLQQQGRFLIGLWGLIAICITYYFAGLSHESFASVGVILLCSILGILGSYGVAWFGIRINTVANSRTAFSALRGNSLATLHIPLRSGMSVGLVLVSIELFFMIVDPRVPAALAGGRVLRRLRHRRVARAPARCASAAASSPRSPTSAPTS